MCWRNISQLQELILKFVRETLDRRVTGETISYNRCLVSIESRKYRCTFSRRVLRCWQISSFNNWSSSPSDSSTTLHNFSNIATFPSLSFCASYAVCIWSLKTTSKFENASLLSLQFQIKLKSTGVSVLLMQHTMLICAILQILAFSKLLRMLSETPQPLLCDPPVGNHCSEITMLIHGKNVLFFHHCRRPTITV